MKNFKVPSLFFAKKGMCILMCVSANNYWNILSECPDIKIVGYLAEKCANPIQYNKIEKMEHWDGSGDTWFKIAVHPNEQLIVIQMPYKYVKPDPESTRNSLNTFEINGKSHYIFSGYYSIKSDVDFA